MKRAVLYTGALRTIKKAIQFFKENVLLNEDVHVFACIQNDTGTSDEEWTRWIQDQMGNNLKQIQWFSKRDPTWWSLQECLVNDLVISDRWKHYLKTSGSMIEYYQMFFAYKQLNKFEAVHGFTYDYILRCRTDSVFVKPIDFHWLSWDESYIAQRIERIKDGLISKQVELTPSTLFNYFMNTLLHENTLENIPNIMAELVPGPTFVPPVTANEYKTYLNEGNYILTMRKNVQYIVRRDLFYIQPSLGVTYGLWRRPGDTNPNWFDAESQFEAINWHAGLTLLGYDTQLEDSSLYNYSTETFFKEDGSLKHTNVLYFIIRH
jgi:hypothetical protein